MLSYTIFNEKYRKSNLEIIRDFYPSYFKDKKQNKTKLVGWHSKKEQVKRFGVLLDIGFKNGDSVLDFGCGLGGLYEYMRDIYDDFEYFGVDINEDFIKKCKKEFKDIEFKKIDDISDIYYKYDWFIASGAFTVYTPLENMLETIKKAHKQTKYGIGVNFLQTSYAKNSNLEAVRGYDKKELFNMFSKEFGDNSVIKIIDDYDKIDFTIYIKKEKYYKDKLNLE